MYLPSFSVGAHSPKLAMPKTYRHKIIIFDCLTSIFDDSQKFTALLRKNPVLFFAKLPSNLSPIVLLETGLQV